MRLFERQRQHIGCFTHYLKIFYHSKVPHTVYLKILILKHLHLVIPKQMVQLTMFLMSNLPL